MMNGNFVTTNNSGMKRSLMALVVFFFAVVSLSAQYAGKEVAIQRLQTRATQVSAAISNLPQSSLEYRYGTLQISTFKNIYAELVATSATVKEAVDKVFADLNGNLDSIDEFGTTMTEYNKKHKLSGFDLFQPIKDEVKSLLK
jgi:hypothetical protein